MNNTIKTLRMATIGICAFVFLTACSQQRFDFSTGGTLEEDEMSAFFINGILQRDRIDAADICQGAEKVASVETQMTFVNGLLGGLTLGIYTPRQYRVYCYR